MTEDTKINDAALTVTDDKGRVLSVKEPDFLQEARVTRLCGDASMNVGYMYAYVFPTVWVTAIDGNPVPFPTTFLQLEALIARVGRGGCAAVLKHMQARQDTGEHEAGVKN